MQPFFPNGMNFLNVNPNQDIKNLENRVYQLEREVTNLKNKINILENKDTSSNYTNNYQPNSYNII